MNPIDIDLTGTGRTLDRGRFDPSSTILGLETTVMELRSALHALYARVGKPRRRAGLFADPLRPWHGVRYWMLALIVGLLGLYVAWIGRNTDFDGTPGWVVYGGVGGAAAFYLALRGAVCFRPKAETLIAHDGRAPVVYLRSFGDDNAMVGRPMRFSLDVVRWKYLMTEYTRAGFLRVMFQRGKVRLEQAIEDEMSSIGPFVAIGEPHEGHPDFGAARAYFEGDDDSWRNAVRSWLDRAAVIVVVPGTTAGLGWELGTIQNGGHLSKVLLIFPPERSEPRTARLTALAALLQDPHWKAAITTSARTDLLALFATGRGDLVRVYARAPKLQELQFAADLALYGMFCMGLPAGRA